jgi:hypothetical protein
MVAGLRLVRVYREPEVRIYKKEKKKKTQNRKRFGKRACPPVFIHCPVSLKRDGKDGQNDASRSTDAQKGLVIHNETPKGFESGLLGMFSRPGK